MDILTDRIFGDMPTRRVPSVDRIYDGVYLQHLKSLSDIGLREETIKAVTLCNYHMIEACRKQWETLGRTPVFLECYNKAVDGLK